MEIKILSANDKLRINAISKLAEEIWFEYYINIFSPQQIAYMLNKFQSESSINMQINDDKYFYYIFKYESTYIGYMSFKFMQNSIFLNNLYIKRMFRNNGIAMKAINFLSDICNSKKQKSIWLTVNINSRDAISKYLSLGFKTIRSQKSNIGCGYSIEEFVMQKEL